MFFVNKVKGDYLIKAYPNFKRQTPVQLLHNIKSFTIIGKSSVFDDFITFHENCNSITFQGDTYYDFGEESNFELYNIEDAGFLFLNKSNPNAWVVVASRSLSILNDFCSDADLSILNLIKNHNPLVEIKATNINNHFSTNHLTDSDTSINLHNVFDLNWSDSYSRFNFDMIIDKNFKKEDFIYYKKFSGFALNIGHFEQIIVQQNDEYPDYFPQANIDRFVTFTDLIFDNAKSVLVPLVLLDFEYEDFIKNAKSTGRQTATISGQSTYGYSVQADIRLLNKGEEFTNYDAVVTKLIIQPNPITETRFE